MREIGPASSNDMVLAFVRAEIDSPIWGDFYLRAISELRFERSALIDQADLDDNHTNYVRGIVLGAVRGYGRDAFLFRGFPPDAQWRRVSVEPADFDRLRYVNCEPFLGLTDDARSVNIGARDYKRVAEFATRVDNIARNIGAGLSTSELILVEDQDRLIVLKGTRAPQPTSRRQPRFRRWWAALQQCVNGLSFKLKVDAWLRSRGNAPRGRFLHSARLLLPSLVGAPGGVAWIPFQTCGPASPGSVKRKRRGSTQILSPEAVSQSRSGRPKPAV
jgi:hypothetical protein